MRGLMTLAATLAALFFSISAHAHHTQAHQYLPWKTADRHFDGQVWVGPISGNGVPDRRHSLGQRSTAILIPTSVLEDPQAPFDVIYWFHGLGGWGERDAHIRLASRIQNIVEACPGYGRFVVVAPEMPWSQNTSTPRGRQGRVWTGRTHVENLKVFHNETLRVLSREHGLNFYPPGKVMIVGHSAGGSAIMSAARSGALSQIRPSVIISSDAGYGSWTERTYRYYVKDNPDTIFYMLVRRWDRPWRNTTEFIQRVLKGTLPDNMILHVFDRRTHSHGDIGDEALLWVYEDPNCVGVEGC